MFDFVKRFVLLLVCLGVFCSLDGFSFFSFGVDDLVKVDFENDRYSVLDDVFMVDGLSVLANVSLLGTVPSGSMRPAIPDGGVLVVKKMVVGSKIYSGDVVVARNPDGLLFVHRVVGLVCEGNSSCWYRTKGDNNVLEDDWLTVQEDVEGVVVGVLW